jgi:hypothetical protein
MLDFYYKNNNLIIENSSKKQISFNIETKNILLDWFDVSFPWEYEKSWILLEVKEYLWNLYYNFLNDWKHIVIITEDNFEIKEEISDFFGDVDILIIVWSKDATKIFENIEAKIVLPYWEAKDVFLNTLWQHIEELEVYKQKWELPIDTTEFINLKLA